ncbi:C40 family peptidase [Latilactobacillus sakei]|uniref:C40 family peptidase n=1 Tax=Latilactobacillus sakei TaxID=1599 RepID=UPI0020C7FA8E|nr:NlpC/P60 family protein [Latilactobacillus sakei]MCP8852074.1 NlpC/P60 family protein [Latilactobacillus sakei]
MNNTKSLIALGSGILGVAGISLLSASQANAATATVNYSAGATTVWTSPETGQTAKRYIFKGQSVNLLASQKVGAETWYRIGNGEWVPERYLTAAKETPKAQTDAAKTIRVAFADGATTVWATPTYTQPTGRYMTYGQTEGVVKTQTVSGEEWYQLANGGWVPARFTGEGQLKSTPVVKQAATPAPVASSSVSESVASSTPVSESTAAPVASESQAESISAPAASSSVVESSSVSSESPAPVAESSVTSESTASAVESSVAPAQSSSATAVEVPAKETVESAPQATPIQAESATVSSTTPSTPVVESSTQQTTPKAPAQQSSVAESKPAVVESTKPTTPTQTTPTPAPTTPKPATPAPTTGNAQAVINLAMAQIGKPYVWGAHGPSSFDCSGLMDYVFQNAAGRSIGGWTVPQESAGYSVSLSSLQPGDLLFWGAQGSSYHVALYIGGGQYVHAPQPGENVKIGSMQYYTPSFAKRVF